MKEYHRHQMLSSQIRDKETFPNLKEKENAFLYNQS